MSPYNSLPCSRELLLQLEEFCGKALDEEAEKLAAWEKRSKATVKSEKTEKNEDPKPKRSELMAAKCILEAI